jgi:aminopeptidase YwaD
LAALSNGSNEMAARILNENLGRGLARMGESHTKGLGYMADATDAASLMDGYKEAKVAVLHQAAVEKGVVRSASVLWTNADAGKKNTDAFAPLIDQRATELLTEVKASYQLQALQRGVPATEPVMTAQEVEASKIVVEVVPRTGGPGGPGGGGGRGVPQTGAQLPQEMNAEFALLLPQHKTALEIRDFLSGEFTPLPLADLMAVLHAREAAGTIKLVPKADTTPAPKVTPRKVK